MKARESWKCAGCKRWLLSPRSLNTLDGHGNHTDGRILCPSTTQNKAEVLGISVLLLPAHSRAVLISQF